MAGPCTSGFWRWTVLVLMATTATVVGQVCQDPLGVESGAIPDASITASSNAVYRPSYNGRLRKTVVDWGGWSPSFFNIGQWLQVDLGEIKRVTGTVTQGADWSIGHNPEPWVTSYKLEYSGDGIFWTTYAASDGSDEVFAGNTDKNTIKTNLLQNPINARYVRFYPQSWPNAGFIAMRVEILGCKTKLIWGLTLDNAGDSHLTVSWTVVGNLPIRRYTLRYQPADGSGFPRDLSPAPGVHDTSATVLGLWADTEYTLTLTSFDHGGQQNGEITGTYTTVCQYPLGMESFAIPDSSITASSIQSPSRYQPYFGRLKIALGWGGWAPAISEIGQWLQVDLGQVKHITGVVTQGGLHARYDRWVTSYKLDYGRDGTSWTTYADGGSDKVFTGNTDRKTPVTNLLDNPVDARYVRFLPQDWNLKGNAGAVIVMRVEILGCPCSKDKATCEAYGDPHFITFDRKYYDFQGSCRYTLAKCKDCTSVDEGHFSVEVQHVPHAWIAVSYVQKVYVMAHSQEIEISRGNTVRVNTVTATPPVNLEMGKIQVTLSGRFLRVELTELCVVVLFDGGNGVKVTIPSYYQNRMSGLCGNYNGMQNDDLDTKEDGSIALNVNDFGDSWVTNSNNCPAGTSGRRKRQTQEDCDSNYSDPCNVLTDTNGPFTSCHNDEDPQIYFHTCVFDTCATEGDDLCASLEAYYDACRNAGVSPFTWRTSDLCPLDCPSNSAYSSCTSACPATCVNPSAPDSCNLPCVEGCECNTGYVLSGLDCVPEADCGCASNNGYYYMPGAVWQYKGEECVCNAGSTVVCEEINGCDPNPCDANAECTDVPAPGTGATCTCDTGYEGDGNRNGTGCTEIDGCVPNPCVANAECTDVPVPGTCTCIIGNEGDGQINGTGCTEIDGCDPNPCVANAECTDVPAPGTGATCTCDTGYEGDGIINGTGCTEISGCVPNPCDPNAECTAGGTCTCDTGYEGDGNRNGTGCTEINGCVPNPCVANAECTDVPAPGTGATCTCDTGNVGDGRINGTGCTEINGCDPNPCDPNAGCTDVPAPGTGATCVCNTGYEGNGRRNGTGCSESSAAAGESVGIAKIMVFLFVAIGLATR